MRVHFERKCSLGVFHGEEIHAKGKVNCPTGCSNIVTLSEFVVGDLGITDLRILQDTLQHSRNGGRQVDGVCECCGIVVRPTGATLRAILHRAEKWAQSYFTHLALRASERPEYMPLTRLQLIELLTQACEMPGDSTSLSLIQCRLVRAIPGITKPHPIEGPVADRKYRLEQLFNDRYTGGASSGLVEEISDILGI